MGNVRRKMLANYCIGELKLSIDDEKFKSAHLEYKDAAQEDFYMVIKQRVEAYFKKRKVGGSHKNIWNDLTIQIGITESSAIWYWFLRMVHMWLKVKVYQSSTKSI